MLINNHCRLRSELSCSSTAHPFPQPNPTIARKNELLEPSCEEQKRTQHFTVTDAPPTIVRIKRVLTSTLSYKSLDRLLHRVPLELREHVSVPAYELAKLVAQYTESSLTHLFLQLCHTSQDPQGNDRIGWHRQHLL
jgi:hypothetical protein